MKKAVIILLCAAMLALTACQPTPEKAVVVQKDQRSMLEQAEAESGGESDGRALAEMCEAPEQYTFSKDGEKGLVFIKADGSVQLPEASAMPIYRVHPVDFTQEQVSAIFNEFCGDAKMIESPEEMTKSEIEEMILSMKQRLNDSETPSDEKQWIEDDIKYWEDMIATAPESIPEVPVDGTLREFEMYDYDQDGNKGEVIARYMGISSMEKVEGYDPMEDFHGRMFSVNNNNDLEEAVVHEYPDGSASGMTVSRRASIWYSDNRKGAAWKNYGQDAQAELLVTEETDINALDERAKDFISLTPAQAKQMVDEFLERIGCDDMEVADMYLTNDENFGNYDNLVGPPENYAYRIVCKRNLNGIPCAAIEGSSSVDEESGWGDSWDYEGMRIMLNDDGIFQFDWYAPIAVEEQPINEMPALMPFADVAAEFEKQIWIQYAPYEDYSDENYKSVTTITVDNVVLEYQRIMEQNDIDNGMLVPVWNFYGSTHDAYEYKDESTGELVQDEYTYRDIIMTVNAVDGSKIDRWKGY